MDDAAATRRWKSAYAGSAFRPAAWLQSRQRPYTLRPPGRHASSRAPPLSDTQPARSRCAPLFPTARGGTCASVIWRCSPQRPHLPRPGDRVTPRRVHTLRHGRPHCPGWTSGLVNKPERGTGQTMDSRGGGVRHKRRSGRPRRAGTSTRCRLSQRSDEARQRPAALLPAVSGAQRVMAAGLAGPPGSQDLPIRLREVRQFRAVPGRATHLTASFAGTAGPQRQMALRS